MPPLSKQKPTTTPAEVLRARAASNVHMIEDCRERRKSLSDDVASLDLDIARLESEAEALEKAADELDKLNAFHTALKKELG